MEYPHLVCQSCRSSIKVIGDVSLEEFEQKICELEMSVIEEDEKGEGSLFLFPLCPDCFESHMAIMKQKSLSLQIEINFLSLKFKELIDQAESLSQEEDLRNLIRV